MISNKEIAQIRRSYSEKELNKASVYPDPFEQLTLWLKDALDAEIIEPNAMVLSTCSIKGKPSSRVVLLKGIEDGGLTFFTNYGSRKAKHLNENPFGSILFFWRDLGRQITIEGEVKKIPVEESENYFASRPSDNQIGAWASKQSRKIPDRKFLEEKFEEYKKKFNEGEKIPYPDFWGGYRLYPERFEFWQGRESRLHDRICYEKTLTGWKIIRLSP
jgi:pyridoxamine 5'-phosphate oxidase